MHDSNVNSWLIESTQLVSFKIKNSPNLFSQNNIDLLEFGSSGLNARRMVVVDKNLCSLYLKRITGYFDFHGVTIHIVVIESEEESKNLDALLLVLDEMERFALLRRSEPVIAIGGGVLLDVVGMASGLYRRGIPYIRVPTTLVGLIDASVGAKTGINFRSRRNRLGSYYPPLASYLDRTFLKSLDPLEISSGMGEILKMAVIKDRKLFDILKLRGRDLLNSKFQKSDYSDEVINLAVQGMKEELENNLWEVNLRRTVDFGHSFSPIIEMRSIEDGKYAPLTHGQAVALDVIFSSVLSFQRGLLNEDDLFCIGMTAKNLDLPTNHELFSDPLMILEALNDTMKHRNGAQNLPIPKGIGSHVFINNLSLDEIKKGVLGLTALNNKLVLTGKV